ncbi:MAG: metalloregulator ArsR/SmtB family transcription factor [Bacteroidota bacterium]
MQVLPLAWNISDKERLARSLRAIAHPVRLSILDLLEKEGKLTVTDIHTQLNAEQSAISHHLSIMRDRNVLGTERKGKYIFYYLKNEAYSNIVDYLQRIQSESDFKVW